MTTDFNAIEIAPGAGWRTGVLQAIGHSVTQRCMVEVASSSEDE